MDDSRRVIDWAGGGGGWQPDPPPEPPATPTPPKKPEKPEKPAPQDPKRSARGQLVATGVVCGRFLPLHRGHQYVIDVARSMVASVRVLVFAAPDDPIAGGVRVRWLREQYRDIEVELVDYTALPSGDAAGRGRAAAVDRTRKPPPTLAELVHAVGRGEPPTMWFGSEPAYAAAAAELGCVFVPVDPTRAAFPASGTALRADVVRHFAQLAPVARPWFARRVAVIGAESTGKSTLCAQLAEHYRVRAVPEYARTLAESRGGDLDASALELAAHGQIASEDAIAAAGDPWVVCDTDARTLVAWHQRVAGRVPAWLDAAAGARTYDLVLATSIDTPFAGRADRDRPRERRAFHAQLLALHPGAVELTGTRADRFARACAEIDALLARGGLLAARAAAL